MIESYYWKEELGRISKLIRPMPKPRRWTERGHCIVERDLMIGFFIVRRLIESHKFTPKIRDFAMEVYSSPWRGKKVTLLNNHRLGELYDVENERKERKNPLFISNQFIHAYTSFVMRDETRNWHSVYVVSDRIRNNCIWRIPISCIHDLFDLASRDYVSSWTSTYNPKKGDYDLITS